MRRLLSYVGLGLVAGAVLHQSLQAQIPDSLKKRRRDTTLVIPVPAHADTLLRDSLARRDSLRARAARDSIKRDTIKAPFTHAELPNDVAIGARLHWDRDALFASGALTLADLLDRVPGLATLHAGWIGSPAVGAYSRLLDGIESREAVTQHGIGTLADGHRDRRVALLGRIAHLCARRSV